MVLNTHERRYASLGNMVMDIDMDNNELHLTDLVDVETLQLIQDAFSDLTGMAALTTDKDGIAVTQGSNFTDFCMKYTRTTELGHTRCEHCDKRGAEKSLEHGKSCTYYCHAGLVDFAAPIMANGEMVGSFIGGQVLTEPPDLEKFGRIARELGIDPELYKEAVKKIRIVDKETVDKAAHFLYVVAVVLSNIAYRSYELNKSKHEVEKASSMKSDFLANMSHEIRTPMNAVMGLADLALREEMSNAAREYIHQVKASSQNLLVIINDILDFSKIESGKMDIIEVEYEPLSLVNDLTGIVSSRIGDKDIEFTMDIAPDLPQALYGDNVRIHQIILNLLTNAVKFTRHGEVHFRLECVRQDKDTAILKAAIRDTGIGIKQTDMDKLFNSFQQVDSKRNRNIEGTGLGLAISQQLLHLMNGKISLESVYEKGTTFFFEIPQKIIDDASSAPDIKEQLTAAILIGNSYVKNQLLIDLKRIDAKYVDLTEDELTNNADIDYLIVEKVFFNQSVRNILEEHPDIKGIILSDYDNMEAIDMPNVRVISKPVYSLGLYNAMGISNVSIGYERDAEASTFTFIAPEANVLVVDDNQVNLTVAKGLLEPLEMSVDIASSAAEAIDKIHYIKYDLIFMDHMMPEVDGIEATRIIRRLVPSYNDVPIIALTANAMGGAREMFIAEGMNDFVAKPIEVKNIVSKLRKWLPKEKIVPVDGALNDSHSDNSAEVQKDSILNIQELDTQQALKLLGTEKLFRTVLKEYYCAIEKKARTIREHKEAGRWRDYTVEVHSLKSTSKQIGANELSALAADLEKAGNSGDIELIAQMTDEMLEMYLNYKEILKPYFPECSDPEESKVPGTEDILGMLEQMQVALDNFDTLQIDEVIESMSEYDFSEVHNEFFVKLKQAAEESDIESCNMIIETWGKEIINMKNESSKPELVLPLLDKMQNALDEFDTLEIDEVIEEMSKRSYSDEQKEYFDKLRAAAENTDIDSCNEILEKWRNAVAAMN